MKTPHCVPARMMQWRNTCLDEKTRQIFASRYQFQLPSEEVLKSEIERELRELGNH
jgi:hypothetical protein